MFHRSDLRHSTPTSPLQSVGVIMYTAVYSCRIFTIHMQNTFLATSKLKSKNFCDSSVTFTMSDLSDILQLLLVMQYKWVKTLKMLKKIPHRCATTSRLSWLSIFEQCCNYIFSTVAYRRAPQIPILSALCPQLNLLNHPSPPPRKNSWVCHCFSISTKCTHTVEHILVSLLHVSLHTAPSSERSLVTCSKLSAYAIWQQLHLTQRGLFLLSKWTSNQGRN
jgi:hypothetical protein